MQSRADRHRGHEAIGARDAGTYTVSFASPWDAALYATEWNHDKPVEASADPVVLANGGTLIVDVPLR